MIEVVCTRKDSACVWLREDQMYYLKKACIAVGFDLDLDGKSDEADTYFDLAADMAEVIAEVCDEESDC